MLVIPGKRPKGRTAYRIVASRDELTLTFVGNFWNDAIIDDKGTTQLDLNIEQVIQEIRAALYFLDTAGSKH